MENTRSHNTYEQLPSVFLSADWILDIQYDSYKVDHWVL